VFFPLRPRAIPFSAEFAVSPFPFSLISVEVKFNETGRFLFEFRRLSAFSSSSVAVLSWSFSLKIAWIVSLIFLPSFQLSWFFWQFCKIAFETVVREWTLFPDPPAAPSIRLFNYASFSTTSAIVVLCFQKSFQVYITQESAGG